MGKAARKLSGAALAEFNTKHPRGPGGRFVKAGGTPGVSSAPDVPSAPTPGRARARLGLAAKADMPAALGTLRAKQAAPVSGDREAVDDILKPMTHAQLDEVAREFGMADFVRGTKEQKARQLREGIVGAKLDRDAIMRASADTQFPRPTQAAAEASGAKPRPGTANLERLMGGRLQPGETRTGRARTAMSTPRTTPASKTTPQTPDHAALERQIMALEGAGMDGRRQAEALLAGMTRGQLRAFASTLGPTVSSKGTKRQLVEGIVEGTIGFRQRSAAINPGGVARRAAQRLQEAGPKV